jgi:hypothetical protein
MRRPAIRSRRTGKPNTNGAAMPPQRGDQLARRGGLPVESITAVFAAHVLVPVVEPLIAFRRTTTRLVEGGYRRTSQFPPTSIRFGREEKSEEIKKKYSVSLKFCWLPAT